VAAVASTPRLVAPSSASLLGALLAAHLSAARQGRAPCAGCVDERRPLVLALAASRCILPLAFGCVAVRAK
jgi:hypothetical protein